MGGGNMDKVLVIGSGGREHALGWKLAQSSHVKEVVYAPGNAATAQEIKGKNVVADVTSIDSLVDIVQREEPDMTIVGPEAPLAAGLADALFEKGYDRVIGPTKAAAQLEASKFFSNELNEGLSVPQAEAIPCQNIGEARAYLNLLQRLLSVRSISDKGIVLKADGLAGGKGVLVCDTTKEALDSLPKFTKEYGPKILVAERLFGEEFSVFALSDGEKVIPFGVSFQDHKRRDDGDKGPNTGGMGAYGPASVADAKTVQAVCDKMLKPVVQKMAERGMPYKGVLYAGMMMTEQGPKVLEYNVRFGDPECQAAMMLLQNDLYEIFDQMIRGRLDKAEFSFLPGAACTIVMAAKGYPESPQTGFLVQGIDKAEKNQRVKVFHAGTVERDGQTLAAGGRVLGVSAYSPSGLNDAVREAYEAVSIIKSNTGTGQFHYRTDIAHYALKK